LFVRPRGGYSSRRPVRPGRPVGAPPSDPIPRFVLINLLPDFFAVLESADPAAAYERYFDAHRELLSAYWHNYVLDPEGPHFHEVVSGALRADRSDLRTMLARTDVVALAAAAAERTAAVLASDVDVDVVLMVGVGAANAGELVVNGRGVAFVCLEHFTSLPNTETQGLGLDPELVPLWLAHEIAHTVRYTSPTSRSEMRDLVANDRGFYSYWETGRQATLRELLMNEGLAVHTARAVSPGHAAWEYFGYARRQYARLRELEPAIARAMQPDLDRTGLGLRLRYLSGGMSDEARTVDRYLLPERGGYYFGARLVEPAIARHGLPWAIRASARELTAAGREAATA
jgi:hypothetical protein